MARSLRAHNRTGKIPLVVITGPTSSGKTALSLKLAREYHGEIISADSRQLYKGLDIGTGKATKKELASLKHHLIDWKKPGKTISLAEYKESADRAIHSVWRSGKIPFLVGGSPLYIKAVVDNYQIPAVPPQKKLRKKLESWETETLARKLKTLDPDGYIKIDSSNRRRLIRALEICIVTKKPFSELQKKGEQLYEVLMIGLRIPREKLYRAIDERVDARLRRGMIAEVKRLIASGVSRTWLSSLGLEYRFITQFLTDTNNGTNPKKKDEYIQKLKYAIHDFARRQLVWFRKDHRIHWIGFDDIKTSSRLVRNFLF